MSGIVFTVSSSITAPQAEALLLHGIISSCDRGFRQRHALFAKFCRQFLHAMNWNFCTEIILSIATSQSDKILQTIFGGITVRTWKLVHELQPLSTLKWGRTLIRFRKQSHILSNRCYSQTEPLINVDEHWAFNTPDLASETELPLGTKLFSRASRWYGFAWPRQDPNPVLKQ